MKMKQIAALFLALMLALSMAACTSSQPSSSTASAEPTATPAASQAAQESNKAEEVDVSTLEAWGAHIKSLYEGQEINLLVGSHPSIDAMLKYYSDFETLTGIKVNFRIITDGTLKNTALIEGSGKAGNYDIFAVDAASIPEFYGKQIIIPIDDYINDPIKTPEWFDYDDILPAYSKGIATSQGVTVGIPIAGETRYLGYRTDLFEKYDKQPPKTMDEFLELAQFFNGLEPGLYGVSMRAASGRQCGSGFMSVAYAFTDSALVNPQTFEPEFNSSDTVEAVNFFVELLKNAPPDVTTYSHEEALSAFIQGNAAMWLDATALTGRIIDPSTSTIADKVDFVPTPDGPKGQSAALAGWNFTIPADSKKADAAWAFIVYMTSRPLAKTYMENGGIPCRTSVYTDAELAAANFTYPKQLEALDHALALIDRGVKYNPDFTYTNDMMSFAGTYISKAMIEELSVEEACNQAQKEMEEFLADK